MNSLPARQPTTSACRLPSSATCSFQAARSSLRFLFQHLPALWAQPSAVGCPACLPLCLGMPSMSAQPPGSHASLPAFLSHLRLTCSARHHRSFSSAASPAFLLHFTPRFMLCIFSRHAVRGLPAGRLCPASPRLLWLQLCFRLPASAWDHVTSPACSACSSHLGHCLSGVPQPRPPRLHHATGLNLLFQRLRAQPRQAHHAQACMPACCP